MGASRLQQEPCEYLGNLEDFSNSVPVPMEQELVCLFVCLLIFWHKKGTYLFITLVAD